ncbi:MAG: hypothetical protein QM831_20510 [Kofleriaceae bacterium]
MGEFRAVEVEPLVDELASRFAPYGLRFGNIFQLGDISNATLHTRPRLLRTVLEDLIHNAFSRSPEIAELAVCEERAALEFRIADRGTTGMMLDDIAFCRGAVEQLGGTLWVEQNAPIGAIVCFQLPMGN